MGISRTLLLLFSCLVSPLAVVNRYDNKVKAVHVSFRVSGTVTFYSLRSIQLTVLLDGIN